MGTRRQWITIRVFIDMHGEGPWACYSCDEQVEKIGQDTWDGNVHHLDCDPSNDDPLNLVMMHVICHQRLHAANMTQETRDRIGTAARGRAQTPEHRAKISAAHMGMTNSPETRLKMSRSHSGTILPEETRKKIGDAVRGVPKPRRICEDCGKSWSLQWINRHKERGWCRTDT